MIPINSDLSQAAADKIVDDIMNQRFENLVEAADLPAFQEFRKQALETAGQYLFALTAEDQTTCWFLMDESGCEGAMIPENVGDSIKPVDFSDTPVWYLNHSPVLN